jgi:crotonobetaine/carnitine-CoA ligase
MPTVLPPLEERTVLRVLHRGASEAPDRVAILDETRSLTYREVLDEALRLGGGFTALGVGRQQPVLLMLDNHTDHAMCWFGLAAVAAIEVPVNVALRAEQLEHVIRDSGAAVLVIEDHYLERLDGLADAVAGLTHVVVRGTLPQGSLGPRVLGLGELAASPPAPPAESYPWDISGVLYTSGTTGRAKGVLVHEAQTYGRQWPTGPGSPEAGDITLVVLPVFHVIGQCGGLYNSMIALATAVILPRFSASTFWDTCRRYGITCAPLVGVMGTYLMRQPADPRDREHSVRRITVGTTFAEVEAFQDRFGVEVYSTYGLTEAGGVIRGRAEPTGCGWIRPDLEARLVDEFDRDVAPGEPGELVLRPTEPWTFMAGYLNRPDATVEKWRNLWLHTGDVMRQREDGQLTFVDRRVDTIRRGGENISTFEVEHQISLHPDIAECAVVAVREDGQEPEVKAVVVAVGGQQLDPVELTRWLAERLPHFAVPRFLEFLPELPRTPSTQRVTKAELVARGREFAWDRQAAGLAVSRDGVKELKAASGTP